MWQLIDATDTSHLLFDLFRKTVLEGLEMCWFSKLNALLFSSDHDDAMSMNLVQSMHWLGLQTHHGRRKTSISKDIDTDSSMPR